MTVTVNLHADDGLTVARIRTVNGTFLALQWKGGSLYLPDYNVTSAHIARTLAADLLAAADVIDPPVTLVTCAEPV